MEPIAAFDTETYHGNVKVLVCADSYGNKSFIETSNTERLLDFLWEHALVYNVFYNLPFDLSAILKQFVQTNAEFLHDLHFKKITEDDQHLDSEEGYEFMVGKYKIRYFKKSFDLINKRSVHFFDIAEFYKTGESYLTLDYVARKYISDYKNDKELGLDREKIGTVEGYYEKHREKIIEYSLKDAELTVRLTQRTFDAFKNIGVSIPEKIYSEASFFKHYLALRDWKEEEKARDEFIESPYYNYIRKSYHGGIFRTLSLGTFEDVYEIDINSAYPAEMNRLYSVVGGSFTFDEKEADYKFYKVKMRYSPVLGIKLDHIFYGVSDKEYEVYINEFDKAILDEYKVPYKVLDFVGIKTLKKRLIPEMEEFYRKKSEIKEKYGKNSVEYLNIKIMINSGYGTFAQSRPRETQFTNFIYASYITGFCRYLIMHAKLLAEQMGEKVLFIATDAIMVKRNSNKFIDYLKKEGLIDDRLGHFSYEPFKKVTIYENGIYAVDNYLKKRGLPTLTFEQLQTEQTFVPVIRYQPLKFMSAIIQKHTDKIADFFMETKQLSPYLSFKRTNPRFAEKIANYPLNWYLSHQIDVDIPRYEDLLSVLAVR